MSSRLPFRLKSPSNAFFSNGVRRISMTPQMRRDNDTHHDILAPKPRAGAIGKTVGTANPDHSTTSLPRNSYIPPTRDQQVTAKSFQNATKPASPDTTTTPQYPTSFRQPQRRPRAATTVSGLPAIDGKQVRLMEAQLARVVRHGDIYAPHDLSAAEQLKAKQARGSRYVTNRKPNTRKKGGPDDLDALAINPIKHYKNFSMMSEFMSEMGRIKHGRETGFRAVNQRRMAKAIRRAIGIGIMPSVHKHPELFGERMRQRSQISVRSTLTGLRTF